MALAYAILGTLQVDYGLQQQDIAKLSVLNTIASDVGCLIGGILADRLGIKRIIGLFYCLTTLPTLYLAFQIGSIGLDAIPVEQLFGVVILHGLMYGAAFAVAERIGYSAALYIDAALVLVPLAVLPFLNNRESIDESPNLETVLATDQGL